MKRLVYNRLDVRPQIKNDIWHFFQTEFFIHTYRQDLARLRTLLFTVYSELLGRAVFTLVLSHILSALSCLLFLWNGYISSLHSITSVQHWGFILHCNQIKIYIENRFKNTVAPGITLHHTTKNWPRQFDNNYRINLEMLNRHENCSAWKHTIWICLSHVEILCYFEYKVVLSLYRKIYPKLLRHPKKCHFKIAARQKGETKPYFY